MWILIFIALSVVITLGLIASSEFDNSGKTIAKKCSRCGKEGSSYTSVPDGEVCPECLAKYYGRCEDCGDYVDIEELELNDGVCEDCLQVFLEEMEEDD